MTVAVVVKGTSPAHVRRKDSQMSVCYGDIASARAGATLVAAASSAADGVERLSGARASQAMCSMQRVAVVSD